MLALAGALAFGLGGRDVAARLLEDAYQRGQDAREQARKDVQKGKARAEDQLDDAYPSESTQRRSASSGRAAGGRTARRRTSTR